MNNLFIKNRFVKYGFSNEIEKLAFLLGVLNNEIVNCCPSYNPSFAFNNRNCIKKACSKTIDLVIKYKIYSVNIEALDLVANLILKVNEVEFNKMTITRCFYLGLEQ